MTREELQKVRDWADAKIATGEEPPWAWYQYMKLVESLDAITAGMDTVTPRAEGLPEPEPQRGNGHLRVVSECPQESAPPRAPTVPVRLPM